MAATIWGRLEHHLTSVGMSDDRTLQIERARCIGIIAEELGAKPVKAKQKRARPDVDSWEKLPLIKFPPPGPKNGPLAAPHLVQRGPSASLDAAITRRLDQIIDASINRKVGYSGDDEVGYDR